jgi:hypothetical protein
MENGCIQIPVILQFSKFFSFPRNLPISIRLLIEPCRTFSPQPVAQCHLHISYWKLLVLLFWSLQTLQELPWQGIRSTSWVQTKKTASLSNSSPNLHSSLPLGPVFLQLSHPWTLRWSIFFCASLYHLPSGSRLIWLVPHVFKIHLNIFLSYKLTVYTSSLPFRFLE